MNALEKRATITLGLIFALRMLGLFMIIPVFSIYGQSYSSATPFLIGFAIGIYGLAQAFLQIPVSMLAEKVNRKLLICIGLFLFAVGGAVAALATDIWQVILGRFLAGAGAVSAVIMALLADVTREQNRSKVMASMGLVIGASIFLAFILAPTLVSWFGMSGLFWLTCAGGLLGMAVLFFVPTPKRNVSYLQRHVSNTDFFTVFRIGNLNRLYMAVFTLHLLMTAIFVLIPINFEAMGVPLARHTWVYLPLLAIGFVLALPLIIYAEAKRKMRLVFLLALSSIALGLFIIALANQAFYTVLIGLGVFFIGFNALEAMIPSWVSKQAPIPLKNTVMGVSSSSQFFGAFLGGSLGGLLLTQEVQIAWLVCAVIALLALFLAFGISSPPYLTSLTAAIPEQEHDLWQRKLSQIEGVEDVLLFPDDGVAYIKIDKHQFTHETRQYLSSLINQPLDFKIKNA